MVCEKCGKEITEGNFINVPCHKQTPQGIISSFIHVIVCDVCSVGIMNKIGGSAKIVEAEIVKPEETV